MTTPGTSPGDLLAALGPGPVERLADLGATAPELVLAALDRWECRIDLIDLQPDGSFPDQPSARALKWRDTLLAAGAAAGRIGIVHRADDLRPCDGIVSLSGFGHRWRIRHLGQVLARAIHADTRIILDLRKGGGGYPWLKARGSCTALASFRDGDAAITRVLFRPGPLEGAGAGDEDWPEVAAALAGPEGFVLAGESHSFIHRPRDPGTLVVTFDNLDIAMTRRADRKPWGYDFIERQGWSMLGVMAQGWTWYRDPWVWGQFDRLSSEGFFARFDRVVFYGASMGGYAACAFAPAHPGCDVIAISPQSTLDPALVPWESRYASARGYDFTGRYGDAADGIAAAGRAFVLFDPHARLDAAHAARLQGPQVVHLRAPRLGHRLGSSLNQMGVLQPLLCEALDGTLTAGRFHAALRARHRFPRYQRELFEAALGRGRPELARRVAKWVLAQGPNATLARALRELEPGNG